MHIERTNPQVANQSDTSCLDVYISDKQDSKALIWNSDLELDSDFDSYGCGSELEMKGFTQIEGQSTQGSDK